MDAFEALKGLSKLGKRTKEIEIGSMKLLLSTMNAEQEGKVFIACSDLTGSAYFSRLKLETLKYALKAVDGARLDLYEEIKGEVEREESKKEILEKVQKILGTWDENVISFLYNKWAELSKESEEDLKASGVTVE
jgi:hypothetical protein